MRIENLTPRPVATDEPVENIKTSTSVPSADAAREQLENIALANKSNLPTMPQAPLDDPLSKGVLLGKLSGAGPGSPGGGPSDGSDGPLPSGPSIRMEDRFGGVNDPDGTGSGEVGDATQKDPGNNDIGFDLTGRSHTEGDPQLKHTNTKGENSTTRPGANVAHTFNRQHDEVHPLKGRLPNQ